MEKPSERALSAFDTAFPSDERAVRKKMFGMPAGFVNGHMFVGVFADGVVLRLPAERLEQVWSQPDVGRFEPMEGRPWKDYAHVGAGRWGGSAELASWVREALEHTATFPPKVPKPRKKKG